MGKLFLLFALLPIAEIAVLVNVSDSIGGWNTVAFVLFTAFVGAYLVRAQGVSTLQLAQQKAQQGQMPGQEMAEGVLLLIAGVLLVTPGFITDVIGFLFCLPFSRKPLANMVIKVVAAGAIKNAQGGFNANFQYQQTHTQHTQSEQEDVIEGEFVRQDDDTNKLPNDR